MLFGSYFAPAGGDEVCVQMWHNKGGCGGLVLKSYDIISFGCVSPAPALAMKASCSGALAKASTVLAPHQCLKPSFFQHHQSLGNLHANCCFTAWVHNTATSLAATGHWPYMNRPDNWAANLHFNGVHWGLRPELIKAALHRRQCLHCGD